jgi:glutamate-1-semialdehyde 2,1-aminomutase
MSTLRQRALQRIPGGVNSPVRAFKSVGGEPIFAREAKGAYLTTTEGRRLLDTCLSFGPLLLGHAHPRVVEAVREAAGRGTSYAVTTEAEIEMAELLCAAVPAMEKVRLVNSGTEAVMTALRLARGVTGRRKILKFAGCYHGHVDAMLVKAGSGVVGLAESGSAGVTPQAAANTLLATYNDAASVRAAIEGHADDLAAIIVEPVAANMGLVRPEPGFLKELRELASRVGALLIFDEVITGFRTGFGGWSNTCCAKPDLTVLGKIIGGGLPIGAVGGRAEILDHLAPEGPVYQAGTLSGNPISVACGLATLREIQACDPYADLARITRGLVEAMLARARERGVAVAIPQEASLFTVFFAERAPRHFADALATRHALYAPLFHGLLRAGVYLPPANFEACFWSIAHSPRDADLFLQAWDAGLTAVQAAGR